MAGRVFATGICANEALCAGFRFNMWAALRGSMAKHFSRGLMWPNIDVREINTAFAVVTEKAICERGFDRSRVNINGGAIALGHALGATGSVLIGTALDEQERPVALCARHDLRLWRHYARHHH